MAMAYANPNSNLNLLLAHPIHEPLRIASIPLVRIDESHDFVDFWAPWMQ